FAMLSERQQVETARALARDAHSFSDSDQDHEEAEEEEVIQQELESEYFRGLHELKERKAAVQAHKALETWVPVVAALGALVISGMLLFKGLNNLELGLGD